LFFLLKLERRSKKLTRIETIPHDEESESSVTRTFIYDACFSSILLREEEAETSSRAVKTPFREAVAEEDEIRGMGIGCGDVGCARVTEVLSEHGYGFVW
jgi:hypothetical protein